MCVLYVSFGSKVRSRTFGCSVNGSVCLVCCTLTVFVNCLVKQFAMCLGVVAILLMNVMEVFSEGGGALLDRPYMVFQSMCMLCL